MFANRSASATAFFDARVGNNYPSVREGTVGPFGDLVGVRGAGPGGEGSGVAVAPAFTILKKTAQVYR